MKPDSLMAWRASSRGRRSWPMNKLRDKVRQAIATVPAGFLEVAQRSTDSDVALENYIAFALVSAEHTGPA